VAGLPRCVSVGSTSHPDESWYGGVAIETGMDRGAGADELTLPPTASAQTATLATVGEAGVVSREERGRRRALPPSYVVVECGSRSCALRQCHHASTYVAKPTS